MLPPKSSSPNQRSDPYMVYNFFVEIRGLIVAGFSEVSGLSSQIELESYNEGGVTGFVHQFPKQVTYPNLVFTRGFVDIELWEWYHMTAQGNIQRKSGSIILHDSQQNPVKIFNFKEAYPVAWEGPQLNAGSETEVAVERLELVHQGIEIQ
ncbi:MAG: phage tail protein [Symploca sp. SIO1B1]|nr:phage tail protein [Symploca sp. SIO1B1]